MSPDILAALAISLAPTIAVIATNAFAMAASRRVARAATLQVQRVADTATLTHTIVNSQRSEMIAQIEALKAEVKALRALVSRPRSE